MSKTISLAQAHEELYAQIPEMACKPGCSDCCGPVPFTLWEWERVQDRRHGDWSSLKCPYAVNGRCEIYEQRPFMCRLFGTTEDARLRCPHGHRPDRMLSTTEARRLTSEYLELMVRY